MLAPHAALYVALSQTENRHFEAITNKAAIIYNFFLLHPISPLLYTLNISKTHSHGQRVLIAPKGW